MPEVSTKQPAPDAIDIPCAPLDGNGTVCIFCRMEMHSECDRTDCECCGGKQ